jgi:NTP pyrophosphatase (non-canonical NTP hydrolase)
MTDPNDQRCRHLYQIRGADGLCTICRDTGGLIVPRPSIRADIAAEMARAMQKFPTWPTDPLHALAVLGEEFGELTKAVLQETYEQHKQDRDAVRKEAIQTAAMALRFAMSLDRYQPSPCGQHVQEYP